jgi:hypothetical protein
VPERGGRGGAWAARRSSDGGGDGRARRGGLHAGQRQAARDGLRARGSGGGARSGQATENRRAEKEPHTRLSPISAPRSVAPQILASS